MSHTTEPNLDEKITILDKRFAKKVDSLNWQSISYQNKAFSTHREAIKVLISDQVAKARIDEAMNCRKMTTGCDQRDYDKRLVTRIKELQEGKE